MRTQIQFLMRTNFCYSTYGWTRWTKMQDSQVSNLVHPVYWNEYHGMDKPLYNRGRPAGCFPNSGYFIFLKYSCVHLKHTKRTSVLSKNLEIIEYGTIFSSSLRSSRDHKCSSESLHHPFKYLLRVKINLKVLKSIKCTKTPKIIMLITSVREMIFITLLVFQEKFKKKRNHWENFPHAWIFFQAMILKLEKSVCGLKFEEAKNDILDYAQFGFHLNTQS